MQTNNEVFQGPMCQCGGYKLIKLCGSGRFQGKYYEACPKPRGQSCSNSWKVVPDPHTNPRFQMAQQNYSQSMQQDWQTPYEQQGSQNTVITPLAAPGGQLPRTSAPVQQQSTVNDLALALLQERIINMEHKVNQVETELLEAVGDIQTRVYEVIDMLAQISKVILTTSSK